MIGARPLTVGELLDRAVTIVVKWQVPLGAAMRCARAALLVCFVVGAGLRTGNAAEWPRGDPNVTIRSVLAQPAFRDAHAAPAAPSAIARWMAAVRAWASDIVRWLYRGAQDAHGLRLVAIVAAACLLALVVVVACMLAIAGFALVLERLESGLLSGSVLRRQAGAVSPIETEPPALRRDAAAAAAAGDYGRAIALLFRAALLDLDRAAIVTFDAARTPGEYRRLVRRALRAASAPFDELAVLFVHASFGTAPSCRVDYEAADRAYGAFAPLAVAA